MKNLSVIVSIALCAAFSLPAAAQNVKTRVVTSATLTTFQTIKTTKIVAKKRLNGILDASITAEWPTGNSAIEKQIRATLNSYFADRFSDKPAFSGNLTNGQALLMHYATLNYNEHIQEAKESHAETGGQDEFDVTDEIDVEYETGKLITMRNTSNWFFGGVANTALKHMTFNKKDGKVLTRNMIVNTNSAEFRQLVLKGLMKYFDVKSRSELLSELQLEDGVTLNNIQNYAENVYINEEGLTFEYGQYQIACGAAGTPYFTIPLSKAKNYLNKSFADCLK